jgi:beta-glucosidase
MGFLGQTLHGYREITHMDMTEGNGIFQGYRWYDKHGVTPQYAFGHGLSYTTFAYSNLSVAPAPDGGATVTFDVKNTGAVRGDEVAQVYVGSGPAVAGVQQAAKSLRGFERFALNPGATRRLSIKLGARSFQYWSAAEKRWVTNYGPRTVWVGGASDQLPLSAVTGAGVLELGGDVPATLALSLGNVASFGTFLPGVARDYTTSVATTVTSTAGDAAMTVFDPSGPLTGRLVHRSGAYALAQPLQVRAGAGAFAPLSVPQTVLTYSGPVSSDVATVDFKQSIGAAEPLRTGSYGKTITFSLSTTTP